MLNLLYFYFACRYPLASKNMMYARKGDLFACNIICTGYDVNGSLYHVLDNSEPQKLGVTVSKVQLIEK